jgi:hypothetical protein
MTIIKVTAFLRYSTTGDKKNKKTDRSRAGSSFMAKFVAKLIVCVCVCVCLCVCVCVCLCVCVCVYT